MILAIFLVDLAKLQHDCINTLLNDYALNPFQIHVNPRRLKYKDNQTKQGKECGLIIWKHTGEKRFHEKNKNNCLPLGTKIQILFDIQLTFLLV
jgi:hypothetical protein